MTAREQAPGVSRVVQVRLEGQASVLAFLDWQKERQVFPVEEIRHDVGDYVGFFGEEHLGDLIEFYYDEEDRKAGEQ